MFLLSFMPGLPVGAGSQFADVHVLFLWRCALGLLPAFDSGLSSNQENEFSKCPSDFGFSSPFGSTLAGGGSGICRLSSGRIHNLVIRVK